MRTEAPNQNKPLINRILLVGAGGHGKVVADALQLSAEADQLYFVDDRESLSGHVLLGVQVLGSLSANLSSGDFVHVAIGQNLVRRRIIEGIRSDQLRTVLHPSALVSRYAKVGSGSFVAAGAVLAPCSALGVGVIVNHGAVVDHDCYVGDYCHVAPLASLAGGVRLEPGVLVGAGARILPGINIGADAVIGAGAVVRQDVASGDTVVGVPARRVFK
ncbi:acetyltransferase [Chitinimonas taiwanensis]|uniref:Sugar O-acyltransferase, sialic acid O-acetyltransferase NeuD family n=1 Tax=Chitinimonas taiwanensis DSM 18899 TaxID=1121279 RepID=A0A1K2HPY2_9NEIS|nr:acetyltransferase [Chitinimonas taiwanensis]SFZ78876.1 sugar O-acyltransferase, sialic acid O-acetyltransferase NeuD family [Chitinimonas taiwanensis DSM 18899]